DQPGRAGDPLGVPHHRRDAVLRDARDGRVAAVEPGIQVVHRLLHRPAGAVGRLLLRLDVLVLLDRHRDRRGNRDRRLRAVLAAAPRTVDTGAAVRAAAAQPEPGDGADVRRAGVLVRADQDRGD